MNILLSFGKFIKGFALLCFAVRTAFPVRHEVYYYADVIMMAAFEHDMGFLATETLPDGSVRLRPHEYLKVSLHFTSLAV